VRIECLELLSESDIGGTIHDPYYAATGCYGLLNRYTPKCLTPMYVTVVAK